MPIPSTRPVGGGWQIRRHPAPTKPLDAARIRSRTLQRAPPDREFLLQTQAVPGDRHALRQNRQEFPCRHPPRRRYDLAQLTTGPRVALDGEGGVSGATGSRDSPLEESGFELPVPQSPFPWIDRCWSLIRLAVSFPELEFRILLPPAES